jgi:pyruvate/2-oxoglutarate dehydrogenase complex dihydrolipoamide dehydrogenase (E3) component/uncharacterized membrane protein YdjX (TVP38/TMEM64 family)
MKLKLVLLAAVVAAILAFFALGLHQFASLEALKSGQRQLGAWIAANPIAAPALFFLAYVMVAALSLPGAAVMTLASGALFGVITGTILASFASTIGATLAMLSARFLLRDSIAARFSDKLAAIDAGMKRDGSFYLFTLRLIPAFPFFVVNLVMGLTALPSRTFYWVSQIAMLPATLVFVNAGTRLAEIESLSGILSLPLVLSFAALGVLPWIARAIVGVVKARRVYAGHTRPARFDRNLIVIGAGAAGLVASYVAAAVRAKVTLIEAHKMGGDCLNYGCVPSKALIRAARVTAQAREAPRYGLDIAVTGIRFRDVMARVRTVIEMIAPHDSIERYTALGVEVIEGHARLVDPWTVEISRRDGTVQRLTARSIVIAAGAAPFVPPLPGLDAVGYLTSDTIWEDFSARDAIPRRITVLGGGPIGCELAQALARLGAKVTQVELADRVLLREDPEVSALAAQALEKAGVTLLTSHKAIRCDARDGEKLLITEIGGLMREIAFDVLIVAVGRAARLKGYGLEDLGIPTSRVVETNAYLETLFPNIFAAGDVAGPYQLTHAAGHQGWHAAVNALFGTFRKFAVDWSALPAVTFLDPEIARVGLNESEAKARGLAFEVTTYALDDLDRAIAEGELEGFVKVITAKGSDRILGATIVGAHAGEILAEFTLAIRHGLGLNKVLAAIHPYPTFSEANKYAAGVWKKAHAPEAVLRLLARYHAVRRGDGWR